MSNRIPSMSSRDLVRLLTQGGAFFVRQGKTDHAIYGRIVSGRRFAAPVQIGKKSLDPNYCKRVLRQLQFSDTEIADLLK
ncbi:MAG: type II toxin-antitoxin system HicA family toxin [Planctomycetes bacterium]|nr:type II toxin-antitoxin system HicA family toxin [Planctomycetota bacterium]MBM4078840.1 type II toxin-antitoxin system HicA family toxin [Planctomycetota bacterium]